MSEGSTSALFFLVRIMLRCLQSRRSVFFYFAIWVPNATLTISTHRVECFVTTWLACFSQHIVAERGLSKVVYQKETWNILCFVFASLPMCARDGPCVLWIFNAGICSRGACSVMFPLPSCVLRLVDNQFFMKMLQDLSVDMAQALFAFGRSQEFARVEWSCNGWLLYSFSQGAAEQIESLTALGGKRGSYGKSLPS